MHQFHCLNLTSFVNNRGITKDNEYELGSLSIGNSSFPESGVDWEKTFWFNQIPFKFSKTDYYDNLELIGQTIPFEEMKVRTIHFLGVSSNGDFSEEISFYHKSKLVFKDRLYLSDFLSKKPMFSDQCAIKFEYLHSPSGRYKHVEPRLWYNTIHFDDFYHIDSITLEDNPFIHIFAITFS
ncbi:hypothetical protein [Cytobacillus pseudoceanisediminis]|uniref:hypothetical protein n=1 Tax=Cytobacillus pseudoceanisediminis TaxID=3051614 RepID=UPI003C2AC6D0